MFFKFTTSGESHGKALVSIVEGLPAGLSIDVDAINHELWRRQQGYGRGGRMKIETDTVEFLAGVRHGKTLGSPIALKIENLDFVHWQEVMSDTELETQLKNPRLVKRPRPGHADLAGGQKFQTRDLRDILERASARETASRVACGALAKQLLNAFGMDVRSHVIQLGSVSVSPIFRELGRDRRDPDRFAAELCRQFRRKRDDGPDRSGKREWRYARRDFRGRCKKRRRRPRLAHVLVRKARWPHRPGLHVDPGRKSRRTRNRRRKCWQTGVRSPRRNLL